MTFNSVSKEIVSEFLHSVVYIDDNFVYPPPTRANRVVLTAPTDIQIPFVERRASAGPLQGFIDVRPIMKAFSDLGVVCSPYRWNEGDKTFPHSSDKADLLILDWKLESQGEEEGSTTSNFIRTRLELDIKANIRLRFIAIYTTETAATVIGQIQQNLVSNHYRIEHTNIIDTYIDIYTLNNLRICRIEVIEKNTANVEQLPDAVLNSFAAFLQGFLPNAVLTAITEIRNHTFDILGKYHKDLDHALISHYLCEKGLKGSYPTAENSFSEYVSSLISSQLSSILSNSTKLSDKTGLASISNYLETKASLSLTNASNIVIKTGILPATINPVLAQDSFEGFYSGMNAIDTKFSKKKLQDGICLQSPNEFLPLELMSLDLFKRTSFKRDSLPSLQFGSIIRKSGTQLFYLCLQPLCDGIRLDPINRPHMFPFLKLDVVADNSEAFKLIVPYNNSFKKLTFNAKPSSWVTMPFREEEESLDVKPLKNGAKIFFRSDEVGSPKYEWHGEIKAIYAQEIAHDISSSGSRIGSDKYHPWLKASK